MRYIVLPFFITLMVMLIPGALAIDSEDGGGPGQPNSRSAGGPKPPGTGNGAVNGERESGAQGRNGKPGPPGGRVGTESTERNAPKVEGEGTDATTELKNELAELKKTLEKHLQSAKKSSDELDEMLNRLNVYVKTSKELTQKYPDSFKEGVEAMEEQKEKMMNEIKTNKTKAGDLVKNVTSQISDVEKFLESSDTPETLRKKVEEIKNKIKDEEVTLGEIAKEYKFLDKNLTESERTLADIQSKDLRGAKTTPPSWRSQVTPVKDKVYDLEEVRTLLRTKEAKKEELIKMAATIYMALKNHISRAKMGKEEAQEKVDKARELVQKSATLLSRVPNAKNADLRRMNDELRTKSLALETLASKLMTNLDIGTADKCFKEMDECGQQLSKVQGDVTKLRTDCMRIAGEALGAMEADGVDTIDQRLQEMNAILLTMDSLVNEMDDHSGDRREDTTTPSRNDDSRGRMDDHHDDSRGRMDDHHDESRGRMDGHNGQSLGQLRKESEENGMPIMMTIMVSIMAILVATL